MSRVVLAMSGGVDSSVAAWLLREAGHEVVGIFMRHGVEREAACAAERANDTSAAGASGVGDRPPAFRGPPELRAISLSQKQGCCTAADAADARRVADRLDIPLYVLDFEQEFGRIVDYFVAEYSAGRTPNPCVMCNNWLKFGRLFDYAASAGAEYVATGHHARLRTLPDGSVGLFRASDAGKDQSYVLFGIAPQALNRLMFPVGEYAKSEIRAMAAKLGLRVAQKPDSQEICFVAPGEHAALVRSLNPEDRGGEIVTTSGEVVGRHAGLEGFTVGQRKGLGVALGKPHYVVRLEPDTRRVVIGTRDELARQEFTARQANWLCEPPQRPLRLDVQIRYRARPVPALVTPLAVDRFCVRFDEPVHAIAPGQAAVCYREDRVLGGGWIE